MRAWDDITKYICWRVSVPLSLRSQLLLFFFFFWTMPPHVTSWLIGKDPDAGRDWGQEKGTTEDEIAGWHHRLDEHESEWTPGVGDGQGGLVCCDSWGHKESDMTEWLNWTELMVQLITTLPHSRQSVNNRYLNNVLARFQNVPVTFNY